jgi:hypothetical protein
MPPKLRDAAWTPIGRARALASMERLRLQRRVFLVLQMRLLAFDHLALRCGRICCLSVQGRGLLQRLLRNPWSSCNLFGGGVRLLTIAIRARGAPSIAVCVFRGSWLEPPKGTLVRGGRSPRWKNCPSATRRRQRSVWLRWQSRVGRLQHDAFSAAALDANLVQRRGMLTLRARSLRRRRSVGADGRGAPTAGFRSAALRAQSVPGASEEVASRHVRPAQGGNVRAVAIHRTEPSVPEYPSRPLPSHGGSRLRLRERSARWRRRRAESHRPSGEGRDGSKRKRGSSPCGPGLSARRDTATGRCRADPASDHDVPVKAALCGPDLAYRPRPAIDIPCPAGESSASPGRLRLRVATR